MPFDTIISAKDLFNNLNRPDWVFVDCRFDLADPSWGKEEYRALHIPGAVYAHTDEDLSGPKTQTSGRHPLPNPAEFCETMSRLGISNTTQVIVYDATSGSFAARLWFLLRFYGHTQVAVLDGGFTEWLKMNYPIETGENVNRRGNFTGVPDEKMIVTTPQVESAIGKDDWLLIDARAMERYTGAQETIDTKAGHIPGAINRFYGLNSNTEGTFRPSEALREEFTKITRGITSEKTIVYCGSGVTSTHHLLAMAIAGLPQPRLYAGSWSEWIRDPNHPIATGEE